MFDIVLAASKPSGCSGTPCSAWETLVSGGAAIGAIVAGLLAVLAYGIKVVTEALTSKFHRKQRRLELLRALRAKLRDSITNFNQAYLAPNLPDYDVEKPKQAMLKRFSEALVTGVPYIPFITYGPADMLWDIIRPELAALDGQLLDDIARYYYSDRLLGQLFSDLRSEEYLALSIDRQTSVGDEDVRQHSRNRRACSTTYYFDRRLRDVGPARSSRCFPTFGTDAAHRLRVHIAARG